MNLAIVILNWNGKTLLEQFLPTVIKFSKEASIYVADNASTDDSIGFLSTYFPEVIIIKNKENGGYAKGYNQGLMKVNADIFCLLNNDVEVTQDWTKPIMNEFGTNPIIAAIQPKILNYKNKDYFEKHINEVLNLPLVDVDAIRNAGFKVVVDAVNSTGGIASAVYMYGSEEYAGKPVKLPSGKVLTVKDVFDDIKRALNMKADNLNVTYDEDWGYPKDVFIDWEELAADEEDRYTIENVVPL